MKLTQLNYQFIKGLQERVWKMFLSGKSHKQISDKTLISISNVRYYIRDYKNDHPDYIHDPLYVKRVAHTKWKV